MFARPRSYTTGRYSYVQDREKSLSIHKTKRNNDAGSKYPSEVPRGAATLSRLGRGDGLATMSAQRKGAERWRVILSAVPGESDWGDVVDRTSP
jgi:hypothetical protein